MRQRIVYYDSTVPLIWPNNGIIRDAFNVWVKQVTDSGLLIGTGTPVGNVEAERGKFYMDDAGAAGSVLFIKQLADVAGDRTQGWVAVG